MTTTIVLAAVCALLALLFRSLELAVALMHRVRLDVLEQSGERNARWVDWTLSRPTLATLGPVVGTQLSVAGVAVAAWHASRLLELGALETVLIALGTALVMLATVELLPESFVPARPTRVLCRLARFFALTRVLLTPLTAILAGLRGAFRGGAASSGESLLGTPPSFLLREDLRKLMLRPELSILPQRETEFARQLFNFRAALIRDIMTPLARVVSVSRDATVGEVHEVVRRFGHTRIPVYEGSCDRLVGVVNVHDLLHEDPSRELRAFLRTAPSLRPLAPAHSLFVELQKDSDSMAFVVADGRCVGIVTAEDVVEEILGEIYDEFELARPRYVLAGRGRLRVNAGLTAEDLARDLDLRVRLEDGETLAAAITRTLGRAPTQGEPVDLPGSRVWVTRVSGGAAVEIEMPRRVAARRGR